LNNWAANNIKGVNLSFGVDQYDETRNGQTSTTTSYSYQVSKSLFNNRFKINVGGNYSTDASADENFSENLINDISFEYMLRQTNNLSMYVSLFRRNDYESILEGEVTETGVGFVMRRRLSNLRSLFRFGRRRAPIGQALTPEEVSREEQAQKEEQMQKEEKEKEEEQNQQPDSITTITATPLKDDEKN
ncbi:MAG: translocation/assembly module TamB, partial [Muribaculaceae bacterium]|nr:translocation/assembly module TamB [Muribaculaceae bacterium]